MLIALRGVQFGLKSNQTRDDKMARLQSRSAIRMKNLISDQDCPTRSAISSLLYSF